MLALIALAAFASCPDEARPCEQPLALSPAAVEALLGPAREAWWVLGDTVTVVARREGETRLCCAMQSALREIAPGLQSVTLRVPDIDSAIFDIRLMPGEWSDSAPVWRGRQAPAAPPAVPRPADRFGFHRIESVHLGEERSIQVYVPPGLAEGERVPVIYLADGLHPEYAAILEAAILEGRVRPAIIVGVPAGRSPDSAACAPRCDRRSQEYLIDIPEATPEELRFDRFARFVAEEVIPLVEASYPASPRPEDRATAGYSSGGAWAVTMAARRPDLFRKAIGLSVGWLPAAEAAGALGGSRVFLGAGLLESGRFLDRTRLAADRARAAGADVRLVTPNGGHAHETWQILFADALAWLFPQ